MQFHLGATLSLEEAALFSQTSGRKYIGMQGAPARAIKLICTDVDGTLLNSDQQLTEEVIEAVQAADDAGIAVRIFMQPCIMCFAASVEQGCQGIQKLP